MEELVKMLGKDFKHIGHEINGDTIYIQVESMKEVSFCPYCGTEMEWIAQAVHNCMDFCG